MRLALVLICLAVVVYTAWQILSPVERRHAVRHITRHGMRIGAIVLAILLLLAAAVYLPASPIL